MVLIVVGALKHYALFNTMCDLKATPMNMQYRTIWKLMLYKLELETTKSICCAKGESAVDHNTVNKQLKKFC